MTGKSTDIVVVLRPDGAHPPTLAEKLGDAARFHFVRSLDEVAEEAHQAPVGLLWNFRSRLFADHLDLFPKLEWVHVSASGVDALASDAVRRRGLTVTNATGVTAVGMAEYTFALLLAAVKRFGPMVRAQVEKRWETRETPMVDGKTMVLVGVGAVGQALAPRAAAFGIRVIGVGRMPRGAYQGFERIVGVDALDDALGEADFLVLAAPATRETAGLLDRERIRRLKPEAIVVNVGRGVLLDESALAEALASGSIAGAALDVFAVEPLPSESPLWELENVLVSPHIAGDPTDWQVAMVDRFVENFRRWQVGEELISVVDLELGYAPPTR